MEPDRPLILLGFATSTLSRAEEDGIDASLKDYSTKGILQVVHRHISIEKIFDLFNEYRERIVIFHYGGHASGTHLQLETTDGTPQPAWAQGLAELMGQTTNLKLVFLNGCATKKQVVGLLREGVNAVIATSVPVEDEMATRFAMRFFKNMARQDTIDEAFENACSEAKTYEGGSKREIKKYFY
ncbi:MAG: CHAT domain-containing protein, partial [bacterium]|nr:CHAT domain-containing protein [bacterium]